MSKELWDAIVKSTADVPNVTIFRLAQLMNKQPKDFCAIVPFLTSYLQERESEINSEIMAKLGVAVHANSKAIQPPELFDPLDTAMQNIIFKRE